MSQCTVGPALHVIDHVQHDVHAQQRSHVSDVPSLTQFQLTHAFPPANRLDLIISRILSLQRWKIVYRAYQAQIGVNFIFHAGILVLSAYVYHTDFWKGGERKGEGRKMEKRKKEG